MFRLAAGGIRWGRSLWRRRWTALGSARFSALRF
jgi:hypothetical protein